MAGKNNIAHNRLATAPGVPMLQFNACDPSIAVTEGQQEITDAAWRPPADDQAAKDAGPR